MASKEEQKLQIKKQAEGHLESFIRLVHPQRVLGSIHSEVCRFWTRPDAKSHQLVLLPRDHGKSALMGYYTAWRITNNPAVRFIYLSSTSNLAVKQLKFIKDILTLDVYRFYWPDMVNLRESFREKWTETEISVDHPLRKAEAIRDPTVFAAGLTTNITGLHCDESLFDDVVVYENAYTEEGRDSVRRQYSLLASIEGTEGKQKVVGTRYHPLDLYNDMSQMEVDIYDELGNLTDSEPLYEKLERQVESNGDGTGEFLWPRQQRYDGRWFGFDEKILAKKKSQYLDRIQFRAQYYNNPNDSEAAGINRDLFQYFDRKHLERFEGKWFYKKERLNLFAAVDFAFSLNAKADYTAIVVVGIDRNLNYYVLDIDRFKTDQISEYFRHILALHQKWDFRKIRMEVSAAQVTIVEALKKDYIRQHGLALAVDEHRPGRSEGTKKERLQATLQPRYANHQIWHYQGGHCQTLEEELLLDNPPHDDIKDALASCIPICIAPSGSGFVSRAVQLTQDWAHSRFGGLG